MKELYLNKKNYLFESYAKTILRKFRTETKNSIGKLRTKNNSLTLDAVHKLRDRFFRGVWLKYHKNSSFR